MRVDDTLGLSYGQRERIAQLTPVLERARIRHSVVGRWRNGRRSGLKIRRGYTRVGSNPTRPTGLAYEADRCMCGVHHSFIL